LLVGANPNLYSANKMFLFSAFIVGFLGSFHCAGMCGPIALALPSTGNSKGGLLINRLLYNSGRIVTYASLGFVAGLAGHTIAMAGFQKALSISSGILIIAIAAGSLLFYRINIFNSLIVRYTSSIKKLFRKFFGQKSFNALFFIGAVNGLLPCGFVYLALVAAIATGDLLNSAAYMMLFGLGTLPMMLSISLAGNFFSGRFNNFIRKATPYIAIAVAILLIARGIMINNHTCCGPH